MKGLSMDKLVATIEKGKPFFDKVARNKYLKAVRDGFISAMPIVIFSSIFLLIAYVPERSGASRGRRTSRPCS
jgi:PTS system lactose-specific IIC component